MRKYAALFTFLLVGVLSAEEATFPPGPDLSITPGDLCADADAYRYPEQIKYCNRSVSSAEKWEIIHNYEDHGYDVEKYDRQNFKIDHLIPLCAGGANTEKNLWPQHKSLYEKTDKLEPLLCNKMADGSMLQAEAVKIILDAKLHPETAQAVLESFQAAD